MACANVLERDSAHIPTAAGDAPGRTVWELGLLAAFVAAVYFTRLDAIPFRGEETRWARVAWEMRETGDWIVPRQQGQVFPDRPPLNSWCMLFASMLTGKLDRLAVRLPAASATLLTVLLICAYSRQFLTRWGALSAGLIYATFHQTLLLGRLAETDAVFTLLVTASLVAWHTGYLRSWPRTWTWTAGYLFAALAGLAKGPQGPLYFVATATAYLALRRDWRWLLSPSHAIGLLAFAAVVGAWQIPFSIRTDARAAIAVWSEQGSLGNRVEGLLGLKWWGHLASYPVEVFLYLLPWSVLLLPWLRPRAWKSASCDGRPKGTVPSLWPPATQVGTFPFLLVFLAVAMPTCWLVTSSRPRHVMAIYPSVACLIAAVIDRSCFRPAAQRQDGGLRGFLRAAGVAAGGLGAAAVAAGLGTRLPWVAAFFPVSWITVGYGAAVLSLGAIAWWAQVRSSPARCAVGIASTAAALGLTSIVIDVDYRARFVPDPEPEIVRLKTSVLAGQRLVSFGPISNRFTFCYQDPIEILPWPEAGPPRDPEWQYFAFMEKERWMHGDLPFAWENVATIPCTTAEANHLHVGRLAGRPPPSQASRPARDLH